MNGKIVFERKMKSGYVIRHTEVSNKPYGGSGFFINKAAYTPEGHYIGLTRFAHRLCKVRGIKPEVSPATSCRDDGEPQVCSIGYSSLDGKWWGWSHRAMYGFKVGDTVKEGDLTASTGYTDEYLAEHPGDYYSLPIGFTAKTVEDTKLIAIAFAESVG